MEQGSEKRRRSGEGGGRQEADAAAACPRHTECVFRRCSASTVPEGGTSDSYTNET